MPKHPVDSILTIVRDTTRGSSDSVIKRGTWVTLLARRRDPDGLKLLVRRGTHGRSFQVRAEDTDLEE